MNEPGAVLPQRSPTTRREAAMCGLSRFWTGRPCRSGHIAERYTSNGQCVQCNGLKARQRERLRGAEDPSYRMYRSVQRRAGQALTGRYSPGRALGCDHGLLRDHIGLRFSDGMSWERYGQWEVDHVIPLSSGRTLEEVVALCHYTNLQPLWKRDNIIKGGA